MNLTIIKNFSSLNSKILFIPIVLLLGMTVFFISENLLIDNYYSFIQKDYFQWINKELSNYPNLIYNLTQFGDVLIILSFLAVFIVYAPELWKGLIPSILISGILTPLFKNCFKVPRPAAIYDLSDFTIIGKTLKGYNSFPSGHSTTIFTVLTVIMIAFMPQRTINKIVWCVGVLLMAYILAFTRVGVGAHYPLDVISGSILGFICGILGILSYQKYKFWHWINNKKYYPIFILLFLISIIILGVKIYHTQLLIFYISIVSLLILLYTIINAYVKK
ncbi:phosphatase PAP2 family protein [Apibacter muscae]|uniref:phosphatase PAP2 family protein n=1 Tax=Apibacter muscae TaxID=2509004 RepID=UPI0011AD0090|nr:phosphatase PAP2 family protein [Apibacter muscae]TWP25199.1 phosphatase PAP2 family protein [Apibacter muscae]